MPWGRTVIPDLPGEIRGLSADGSVVVGLTSTALTAFRWKLGETPKLLATFPGSSLLDIRLDGQSVSANGAIVVGKASGFPNGTSSVFRWDADADQAFLLPTGLASEADDFFPGFPNPYILVPYIRPAISNDGNTIVGLGDVFSNGVLVTVHFPFIWTASSGTSDSIQVPFLSAFEPFAVSGDGSGVAGNTFDGFFKDAAMWRAGVGEILLPRGEAEAISHDGDKIAGRSLLSPRPAFTWTLAGGLVPGGPPWLHARSIADDGNSVAWFNPLVTPPLQFTEPWFWDSSNGYRWMQSMLSADFGIQPLNYGSLDEYGLMSGNGHVFSMVGSDSVANVAPLSIVGLGDSFSSGEGVPPYPGTDEPTNKCHRSDLAYPRLARPRGSSKSLLKLSNDLPSFEWRSFTCSGATTQNVVKGGVGQYPQSQTDFQSQLDGAIAQGAIGVETDFVTITIGGNDAFFERLIKKCVSFSSCHTGDAARAVTDVGRVLAPAI